MTASNCGYSAPLLELLVLLLFVTASAHPHPHMPGLPILYSFRPADG